MFKENTRLNSFGWKTQSGLRYRHKISNFACYFFPKFFEHRCEFAIKKGITLKIQFFSKVKSVSYNFHIWNSITKFFLLKFFDGEVGQTKTAIILYFFNLIEKGLYYNFFFCFLLPNTKKYDENFLVWTSIRVGVIFNTGNFIYWYRKKNRNCSIDLLRVRGQ